jgi:hypothetical protein
MAASKAAATVHDGRPFSSQIQTASLWPVIWPDGPPDPIYDDHHLRYSFPLWRHTKGFIADGLAAIGEFGAHPRSRIVLRATQGSGQIRLLRVGDIRPISTVSANYLPVLAGFGLDRKPCQRHHTTLQAHQLVIGIRHPASVPHQSLSPASIRCASAATQSSA